VANSKKLIVVVGPTAVGKTTVAIELAKHFQCEILSADSRQFYKEMSIGTAKPTAEEMDDVPHHFVNNLSIEDDYSAGIFEREALDKLDELYKANDYAILVGGSGLFINALCEGLDDIPKASEKTREQLNNELATKGLAYIQNRVQEVDPEFYATVDINNTRRLTRALEVFETSGNTLSSYQNTPKPVRNFDCIWIGLDMPREVLYDRINHRVDSMMEAGLLDEVAKLEKHKDLNPLKTVGYQEFYTTHEVEKTSEESINQLGVAINLVKRNSRRYAKRQLTWFRRNKNITWFKPQETEDIINSVKRHRTL